MGNSAKRRACVSLTVRPGLPGILAQDALSEPNYSTLPVASRLLHSALSVTGYFGCLGAGFLYWLNTFAAGGPEGSAGIEAWDPPRAAPRYDSGAAEPLAA
jgi:hypothetical protein